MLSKQKKNSFEFTGHTGQTLMNERSSRSHAIFSITIECSDKGPDGGKRIRVGKLHMVDLAVKCVQMKKK